MSLTVYQKPTCSKCQRIVATLKERSVPFTAIDYYQQPLTPETLLDIFHKLGPHKQDIVRTDEDIYQTLELKGKTLADHELAELLIVHPDLMQRPILVTDTTAAIVRDSETLTTFLTNI